jgi:hypothetical protein
MRSTEATADRKESMRELQIPQTAELIERYRRNWKEQVISDRVTNRA